MTAQELDFQETLIAEREAEIRDIESGIHELNDIFRDLGTIVSEQGGLIGEVRTAFFLIGICIDLTVDDLACCKVQPQR